MDPAARPEDLRQLFEAQRETARRWRSSRVDERRARIRRLRDAVQARRAEIHEAGARDFHKPPEEVDLDELLPVIGEANETLRRLQRWMRPQRVPASRATPGTRSFVQYEPRGRCLILSPWNYPLNLTLGPLVSALAAGNTAILKPSELTPALSAVVARIVADCFAPEEVAVVQGDAATASALLDLPFDHIFFTGSTRVGRLVMAAAARHLASVTLELGGKSPTIVDASADLDAAARDIAWGKFNNNGQTCVAPDHVYVQETVFERFAQTLCRVLQERYGPLDRPHAQLARLVDAGHTARVAGLLDDARARGAKLLCGGAIDTAQRYVAPTVLAEVPADARLMQEEIFGPLLPLIRYTALDEVIAAIDRQDKPLALYLWSRDAQAIAQVLRETTAGSTAINATVVQFGHAHLPFGGVNQSGQGSAHGFFGFRAFSHERAVLRSHLNFTRAFYPPYTALTRRLLDLLLRWV